MSLSEISEAFAASGEGWTEGRRKLQRSLSLQDTGTPQRRGSFTLTMRYGFLMSHILSPITLKADWPRSWDNLQEPIDYRHRHISRTYNGNKSHQPITDPRTLFLNWKSEVASYTEMSLIQKIVTSSSSVTVMVALWKRGDLGWMIQIICTMPDS